MSASDQVRRSDWLAVQDIEIMTKPGTYVIPSGVITMVGVCFVGVLGGRRALAPVSIPLDTVDEFVAALVAARDQILTTPTEGGT